MQSNDRTAALADATAIETAWDDAQPTLEAADPTTWTAIDGRIDATLTAVRSTNPAPESETAALDDLLAALT